MFSRDFYPTPESLIYEMISGIDLSNAVVLEPSAGKGDILDAIKPIAKETLAVELSDELRHILHGKGYNVIGKDFLEIRKERISHITHIVMNPPFSKDAEHILHAYNISPQGTEIVALCNYETIQNSFSSVRRQLKTLIKNHGTEINIGDVFSTAQRKTNVEVGLIRLYKPASFGEDFDYSMFFMDDDGDDHQQQIGLMPYNEIRAIVNTYVGVMKDFEEINKYLENINNTIGSKSGFDSLSLNFYNEKGFTSKEIFARELQAKS